MISNRMPDVPPDPPDEPNDKRLEMIPDIPEGRVRKFAGKDDAEALVAEDARKNFRSYPSHRERKREAQKSLATSERAKKSRDKTLDRNLDKRDRLTPTTSPRYKKFWQAISFSNLPSLTALFGTLVTTLVFFGGEQVSCTLLMQNSGWGITENVWLTVLITAVFSLQPFYATKLLIATLPSCWALKAQVVIAILGIPMAVIGIWAVSHTLGPLAEAEEFSMVAAVQEIGSGSLGAEDEQKPLSKTTYLLIAMFGMWFGAYASFYWFSHYLDQLVPVTTVDREEYAGLTERIERSEREIAYYDERIIDAREALETEKLLEEHYVELCLACLEEAQEELKALKDAVRLSPYVTSPSAN